MKYKKWLKSTSAVDMINLKSPMEVNRFMSEKLQYERPVLTKHAQLREVTLSSLGGNGNGNGNGGGQGNNGVGNGVDTAPGNSGGTNGNNADGSN